jgi:hypothetical protein
MHGQPRLPLHTVFEPGAGMVERCPGPPSPHHGRRHGLLEGLDAQRCVKATLYQAIIDEGFRTSRRPLEVTQVATVAAMGPRACFHLALLSRSCTASRSQTARASLCFAGDKRVHNPNHDVSCSTLHRSAGSAPGGHGGITSVAAGQQSTEPDRTARVQTARSCCKSRGATPAADP